MKIALFTIYYQSNYGSVLQGFATNQVLSQYGEVQVIDFFNPQLEYKLDLVRFELSIQGILRTIHDILRFKDRYKVVEKFKKFIKQNINSTRLLTRQDIQKGAVKDFDIYVCGSNQIWNLNVFSIYIKKGEIDSFYFLSFANKKAKKISYASSMGGRYRLTDSEKGKVKVLLKDFTAISVRERDAQEMLSQLLGRDVFHVLDPTLLLSKEEWFESLEIDKKYRSQKEDYILVYSVQKSSLIKKAVDFFVKKLGIKVVTIDQRFKPFINADIHIRDAGPLEFIELFANASFVITDSFHGTCFSINFKIPFVSILPVWGANRIEDLLNLLNLNDRLIINENSICQIGTSINYTLLENKFLDEKAKSFKFLKSNLVY